MSPVCVPQRGVPSIFNVRFKAVLEDQSRELLLCGRPKTLAGEDGPQVQNTKLQNGRRTANSIRIY